MFDARTLIIGLGMLALSTAIDPNNLCALVTDETRIVDEDNCAKYYLCESGKATSQSCSNGQYFSKDDQHCLPKDQVKCQTKAENACEGLDKKFVSSGTCSGYYYCNNGVATAGNCPNNLNFDESTQKCRYSSEYSCSVTGSDSSINDNPNILCAYIPSGLYFGSAASCDTWIKCTGNEISSGTCNPGLVFNVQTGWCNYKGDYDCQQLKGDSSETGGSPLKKCDDKEDKADIKDPDSCSGFLQCSGKTYVKKTCAGGYFDVKKGKCASRMDAANDCDRCEGTTLQFVNNYNDNCRGYLICENGKKIANGTCPDDYYFDEKFGSCIKGHNPGYGACKTIIPVCDKCTDSSVIYGKTVVNNCNSDCATDAEVDCDCTCATCPLKLCEETECIETSAELNKCTSSDESKWTCSCADCQLIDCPVTECVSSSVVMNKCTSPDDSKWACSCEECDLPACAVEECVTTTTAENKCNPLLETEPTQWTCSCEECELPACAVEECVTTTTAENKCNPLLETEPTQWTCSCEECELPACAVEECVTTTTAENKCNPLLETEPTQWTCSCENCD